MAQGDADLFVMGLPVFMDYYTVHDEDNGRLGFVPHNESEKGNLERGSQPSRVFASADPAQRSMSPWTWVIASLFLLAFIALWVIVIVVVASAGTDEEDDYDDEEFEKKRKTRTWSMVAVAFVFVVGFGVIIYFYMVPIINRWFVKHPDNV